MGAPGAEIESIYVSFGGDGDAYFSMLDTIGTETKATAKDVVSVLDKAADEIAKQFEMQAKTFSMTSREIELFRLQMAGATDEQLKAARAANDALTALEKEQQEVVKFGQLRDEVAGFTQTMNTQAKTFGMTSRQAEIYRLTVAGATKQEIMAMQAADRRLARLEKENELKAKGKSLTDQYRTSQEKFNVKQKEYDELLHAGAIDAATYQRAMEAAKKELGTGWDRIANAMNPANTAIMQIGQGIQNIGRSYSMYVTAPIAAFGALGVSEFGKFNQAMTEGFAIMGDIDDMMKNRLQKTVRDMSASRQTRFGPDELAGGLKNLAAAGLSAEQSMQSLGVVERFATAGAFGLDRASQLLLDSQSALGLIEKDAIKNKENLIKVSDALVKAGDQSTAAPEQFAEALANGAADAKNFGMELSTTMAVLDAYASKGNKGAAAGSDLARATRLLSKAVREHGDVFKKLGIEPINEATGEYRNFIDIVGQMEKAFENLTGPERSAMLELMGFEALAQSAILPLIGMSKQMKVWEQEQKSATDYTKNVAEKQMKSFQNQMLALWGQLKEVGIEIGEHLVPTLNILSNSLSTVLMLWRELPGPIKTTTVAVGGLVAAIGPLLLVFGGGTIVVAKFVEALKILGVISATATISLKAMWAAALPVASITAAIAAGVGLGALFDQYIGWSAYWIARMKEQLALTQQLQAAQDRLNNGRADKDLQSANGMQDPQQKRQFLTDRLGTEEKNVQGLTQQVNAANKRVEELSKNWRATFGWKILDTAKQELLEVSHNLEQAKDRASKFRDALGAMGGAGLPAVQKVADVVTPFGIEIEEVTNKLKDEVATFKQSTNEAKLHELAVRGATEAQLAEANALAAKVRKMKAEQKQREQMASYQDDIIRLQAEAEMFGQGARAIEIYRMQLSGASTEQIEAAKAADATITRLEKEKKAREKIASYQDDLNKLKSEAATFGQSSRAAHIYQMELEGASAEQIAQAKALDKSITAMEKYKKLQEKAAETTKKHADPMIRFNNEQKEFKEMLDAGLISLDTYNRALRDTWKEMAKEYKVNFKVGGVDAVAAGSAEAIVRAREFLSLRGPLNNPLAGKRDAAVPAGVPQASVPDFTAPQFKGAAKPYNLTPAQESMRQKTIQNMVASRAPASVLKRGARPMRPPSLAPMSVLKRRRTPQAVAASTPGVFVSANPNSAVQQTQTASQESRTGDGDVKNLLAKIEQHLRPDPSKPQVIFQPATLRK